MELLDSGATHPLRKLHPTEDVSRLKQVEVTLADGMKKLLYMTPTGVMVTAVENVEPIVPMGLLTTLLNCSIKWKGENIIVDRPKKGRLTVEYKDGCPMVPREAAMDLIKEIEEHRGGVVMKGICLSRGRMIGSDLWYNLILFFESSLLTSRRP